MFFFMNITSYMLKKYLPNVSNILTAYIKRYLLRKHKIRRKKIGHLEILQLRNCEGGQQK